MHMFQSAESRSNQWVREHYRFLRRGAFRQMVPGTRSLEDEDFPEQVAPDAGLDDKLDVVKALGRIAPIDREVPVLFYFDDMPTAQMAEALEVAPGTVLSRLARAREALKAAMGVPARPAVGATVTALRKERTLRGSFMQTGPPLRHLGLEESAVVPGFPQLMRPCDIDGHLVYHLTTFFEKGGMVTVFAFDRHVALKDGGRWWGNVHWKAITSRDGKPLVLVAQKKQALAVAQGSFTKTPG